MEQREAPPVVKSRLETSKVSNRIRVIVSDSNYMGCQLLATYLKSRARVEVLATATTSGALVASVCQIQPEIAVISARLADGPISGLDALKQIRMRCNSCQPIVLFDSHDRELTLEAYNSGAKGVVFRTDPVETLQGCIRRVSQGQVWADQAGIHDMLSALSISSPLQIVDANGTNLLTPRQKQLVNLVAEGMSNRDISQQLRLSEHTVKNYLFRIFDKLGVSSRAELIVYALNRHGEVAQKIGRVA